MAEVKLEVMTRDGTGKSTVQALRREGRVPAVFYAHGENPVTLSVDAHSLKRLLMEEHTIIDVIFPGNKVKKCILKEVQLDPVSEEPVHIDIMGIKMSEKIKLSIPVVFEGTPAGVKEGGVLEHGLREVEVEGLPLDIPDHLSVDVSELKVGDSISLGDMAMENIRFLTDEHHVVASVAMPRVTQVVTEEEVEGVVGEEVSEEEEAGTSE